MTPDQEANMNTTLTSKDAEDKVFRAIDGCLKDFQIQLINNAQGRQNSIDLFRVDLSSILAKMIVSIALEASSGNITAQEALRPQQDELDKQLKQDQQESIIRLAESSVNMAQQTYDNAVKEWEAAKRAYSTAVNSKLVDSRRRYELQRVCSVKYQTTLETKAQLDSAKNDLSRLR
jgi:hypothetical protein